MNTRLIFGLLCLTPTLCFGALSTDTSYFLNVEALTNVVARSAVRGLTGVFTNSLSAAGLSTSGTTNATLTGNLLANGGVFTNGITAGASTFTGVVGFADGIISAPSIGFTSSPSSGFFWSGTRLVSAVAGGSISAQLAGNYVLGSTVLFGWSNGSATGGNIDTGISRDGAANTMQGGSDSATATAFTFKGPDGSGTDKVGGAKIEGGGLSTGTAASGSWIVKTGNSAGGSSSSINTFSERIHAIPKWVTLTSATATTLFTIPVPATNYVGLTATVTIYATDGTDHQSKTSVITVDAIAKTTTITPTITQVDNTTAASAGTLTCTYTAVDNTSNVLAIKANADSSLTETVLRAKIVITAINSNGTGAVTEQ